MLDRLPTLLFGLAAVLAATGYLLGSTPNARAQFTGPVVTGGEAPWVSVSGTTTSADEVVYTVPADRTFILTGLCADNGSITNGPVNEVTSVTTPKIRGMFLTCTWASNTPPFDNFVVTGRARIPFAGGSGVQLQWPNGTQYTVQGYLVQP